MFDIITFFKIVSCLAKIIWLLHPKENNIIYLNSNKKILSIQSANSVLKNDGYKCIKLQSHHKNSKFRYKYHFARMIYKLNYINYLLAEKNKIIYGGFVSPMFAAYDGYVLGNNRKYSFIGVSGVDSKEYLINYSKKEIQSCDLSLQKITFQSEMNLFVCSSKDISHNDINKPNSYVIDRKCKTKKIKDEYLNDIYCSVKNFLELCSGKGVKSINLYIAAKQPVSFVIGTAIERYHPTVIIYEYINGKYSIGLNVQKGRLIFKDEAKCD